MYIHTFYTYCELRGVHPHGPSAMWRVAVREARFWWSPFQTIAASEGCARLERFLDNIVSYSIV